MLDIDNIGKVDNKINLDKLKSELNKDIARNFNLDEKTVRNLVNLKTETGLEGLKSELDKLQKSNILSSTEINSIKELSETQKEKLFNVLKGYKNVIEKASRNKLDILKDKLNNGDIIKDKTWLEKRLPTSILNKLKNPNGVGDQVLGIALGTINSAMTTVEFLYKLGAGIIKSPYHIYLITSGKANYDIPKNI